MKIYHQRARRKAKSHKGRPEAMNIVAKHYGHYIASLSMRKLRDLRTVWRRVYRAIANDTREKQKDATALP